MRYFLGFLVAIGLIILVVILIVRALGGGGSDAPTTRQAVLSDYADTAAVVRLTIDDRIEAEEDHYSIQITVGRDERTVKVIRGYEGDVVNAQTFSNSQASYTVFLKSLQYQGYTNGDTDKAKADERGLCPTSRRYIYEVVSPSGDTTQRFWSSECKVGTFQGNGMVIRSLFRDQIPDYRTHVRGSGIQ